jgi:glycosyltransferase involved in cell wall biosynthesis
MKLMGGGELVSLATMRVLSDHYDADIDLYTGDKPNWEDAERKFGKKWIPKVNEHFVINVEPKIPIFKIYQRMILSRRTRITTMNKCYDIVINTFGDMHLMSSDLVYLHYPCQGFEAVSRYNTSLFWKLYYYPFMMYRIHDMPREVERPYLLFNSSYTMIGCATVYGKYKGEIVHPPVDDQKFSRLGNISFGQREDSIITISRIALGKGLERVVDIASRFPDIIFHIAGGTSGSSNESASFLREIASSVPNVKIHCDASYETLMKLLSESKIYLHTMIGEHFGISIVEAMHSGLPVIVHRSGGPYTDILDYDKFGMSYEDNEELERHIQNTISNSSIWEEYHNKSLERSRQFTYGIFEKNMVRIINKVLETKKVR